MSILSLLLIVAGYIVIMRWVLPRLGVPTWMSQSCDAGSRRTTKESPQAPP